MTIPRIFGFDDYPAMENNLAMTLCVLKELLPLQEALTFAFMYILRERCEAPVLFAPDPADSLVPDRSSEFGLARDRDSSLRRVPGLTYLLYEFIQANQGIRSNIRIIYTLRIVFQKDTNCIGVLPFLAPAA